PRRLQARRDRSERGRAESAFRRRRAVRCGLARARRRNVLDQRFQEERDRSLRFAGFLAGAGGARTASTAACGVVARSHAPIAPNTTMPVTPAMPPKSGCKTMTKIGTTPRACVENAA